MKPLQTITMLILTCFVVSCSKDDDPAVAALPAGPANYSEITMADIIAKESNMGTTPIIAVDASGVLLVPGTVLIYKTSDNRYGKCKIISIDTTTSSHRLTLDVTTYRPDGTVYSTSNVYMVDGTFYGDLDGFVSPPATAERDFQWNRQTATNTRLNPQNGAKFYKYNF